MTSQALSILNTYLLPFALVVPFVILLFALRAREPAAPPAGDTPAAPAPPKPAVLVVDDSAVVRAKLRRLLEGAGCQVELACDGQQALDVLARERCDVLLTDLEMPTMDGFALIAAVQGALETEQLPIIAITGHDELQARVHAMQGLYGLYKKPWNDRQLLERVQALARLGGGRRAAPQARAFAG